MSYHKNEDIFRYFISGLDKKMQAELSRMFVRNGMMEREERRKEMEQMKREITEEVMSRISIWIETEAIAQLRDLLNSLGQ